jgi:WD40 repeat protein
MKSRFDSRCARITLISCLVALAAGCREPLERRAVAQIPGEGQVAGVASASPRGVSDVSVRRVWADDYIDFYAASISPDGRYLSMIDWSTVDLAVRDLQTGELHRLTNVVREEGKPYEDAGVSVFSRDGRQLVVGWQYFPDLQLRLVDFEPGSHGVPPASDPTVLFHNSEFEPYYPFDWSPDDGQILAKVYTAGGNQLALISATDGTYRALKSFDWREPTMAEFSPDGKFVAYDFLPDTESADRDIYVAAIDGQQDTRIVEGPGIDRLLGWHPDGSILFHSDRGGTPGIWRVPMMDGRAAGPAELVRADIWNAEPLGFAGRDFYYGVDANPVALYTATVSLETGELIGTPEQLVDPTQVSILGLDWSPDGRFLAYSGSSPGMRGSVLGLVGPNGEERVRLDLGRTRRILWHPDGRSLIAFARDSKDRRGFYRIDPAHGPDGRVDPARQLRHLPGRCHAVLREAEVGAEVGEPPRARRVRPRDGEGPSRRRGELVWPGGPGALARRLHAGGDLPDDRR